jgi:hypothetical protein
MKTKNQLQAFFGLGALSLLTAALSGATMGCVADRPSRNSVFDENQYLRKDWLVRAGDSTTPDNGWLLKATITDASEPNVYGGGMYGLFPGAHSDGQLVHFTITSDHLNMLDNREVSTVPSVGTQSEVINAWPIVNVDLKYYINLNGEKTNSYVESQELDWQVRQWVKLTLDHNDMTDLAPLGSFVTANLATCAAPEGTSTLVPNSFVVDEAHDYMEWAVQITIPISWTPTCMESYGAMGPAAEKLGRQYETVNLKYSLVRANPNPQQGSPTDPKTWGKSFAEDSRGAAVAPYQPLIVNEKDQILHKYSPFIYYSWNRDADTGLLASQKMVMRHNPQKDQRWYFEKGFPDQYKNIFTRDRKRLPVGVAPLPAGIPTIEDATNQMLVQANTVNPSATGRVSFHEYNEPLDDGSPIERSFGDVRFNMVRWLQTVDQQSSWAGVTGFVNDPRTGEILSSDIVLENFQIKDYYVARIDAYLTSIGASPGILNADFPASPTDANGQPLPVACTVGDAAPIVPATVLHNHNGLSTLYQKMQGYLFKPSSAFGPLGAQDFIAPQDADFFRAYFAYLPYIIYADPATNPYVTPESAASNTSPSAGMWQMVAQEQQFHAASAALDQGHFPYDPNGATGVQDALDFMNQYKQMSINHHAYRYALEEINSVLATHNGGNNNNAADQITDFAMESVMAKDARHCVTSDANPTPHWESKQEWIDSLTQTYWSQVMWHEFGHSQGLTHNFMASVDKNNFPVQLDASGKPVLDSNGNPKYKLYASSVMEYNAPADRVFWGAGWAPYDIGALTWMYGNNGSTPASTGTAIGASGQLSATAPWNDPAGYQADGKTEIQFLVCNEDHEKYTPLCRKGDLGITPSEITANDVDSYEWQYAWRNFRTYHKVWDDSAYADQPMNFVTEARRFLSLWNYDMSSSELTSQFLKLGITPPPDAPSAQAYYGALTNKFNNEMGAAAGLTAAFHEAIIEQSPGQRPYVTQIDNYFGDVTVQGITLDKLDALQSFVALWPVDNYDQNQGAGAFISSFTPFGYIATPSGAGVGAVYQSIAEDGVMAMLAGSYAAFPYFAPLGVAMFTQDTQSVNYAADAKRRMDARDWTGSWTFNRLEDFLAFFQDLAVQRGFAVPPLGINCDTLADCNGANGNTVYDPRNPQAFPSDIYYSNNLNEFLGPDGRRYIWIYIYDRKQWVVCDEDRNVATFQAMLAYTTDILQSQDDGNPGADTNTSLSTYGLLQQVKYFVDYFQQFGDQYYQSTVGN